MCHFPPSSFLLPIPHTAALVMFPCLLCCCPSLVRLLVVLPLYYYICLLILHPKVLYCCLCACVLYCCLCADVEQCKKQLVTNVVLILCLLCIYYISIYRHIYYVYVLKYIGRLGPTMPSRRLIKISRQSHD